MVNMGITGPHKAAGLGLCVSEQLYNTPLLLLQLADAPICLWHGSAQLATSDPLIQNLYIGSPDGFSSQPSIDLNLSKIMQRQQQQTPAASNPCSHLDTWHSIMKNRAVCEPCIGTGTTPRVKHDEYFRLLALYIYSPYRSSAGHSVSAFKHIEAEIQYAHMQASQARGWGGDGGGWGFECVRGRIHVIRTRVHV